MPCPYVCSKKLQWFDEHKGIGEYHFYGENDSLAEPVVTLET
jgi:hypothetical protein